MGSLLPQVEMFDGAPFSNETTSLTAAREVVASGRVMTQRQRILVALEGAGKNGATHEELAEVTGIGIRQVSTRVRSLVLAGLARDSGRKAVSRSGAWVIVWEAWTGTPQEKKPQTHGRIAAAVANEREACALLVESFGYRTLASLIRKRGSR